MGGRAGGRGRGGSGSHQILEMIPEGTPVEDLSRILDGAMGVYFKSKSGVEYDDNKRSLSKLQHFSPLLTIFQENAPSTCVIGPADPPRYNIELRIPKARDFLEFIAAVRSSSLLCSINGSDILDAFGTTDDAVAV